MFTSAASNQTYQFTGKERDETGLDWFITRYLSSAQGRFSSPDSYNIIFEKEKGRTAAERNSIFLSYLSNPQVWNKYAYVLNNPLNSVDPDGRRDMTDEDFERLRKLRDYALATGDQEIINTAYVAIAAIMRGIIAVPEGELDPIDLLAAFTAIDGLGSSMWGKNGTVTIYGHTFSPPSSKCNLFVAYCYTSNGADYPLVGKNGLPPRSNTLAGADEGIGNFESVSTAGVGGIVAWGTTIPIGFRGHSAISVGGGLVIYAGREKVIMNTIDKTGNLLEQQSRIPFSYLKANINFLRYKQ